MAQHGKKAENISRRRWIQESRVGPEKPDPTPVELPTNMCRPESLREEMMRFIRTEISKNAEKADHETFEEFDDLDIPDEEEPDLTTAYTVPVQTLKDEEGAYLLEPTENPPEGSQEAPQTPLPPLPPESQEPEATSAEGAEGAEPRNTEPARLTNDTASQYPT